MEDFNAEIIEEFRANGGKVGGMFAGAPLLILHSTGAKSGETRTHPMMYQKRDDGYAIFASMGGAPTNPAWYHNLVANPDATIEIGGDTVAVTARVTDGEERTTIWEKMKSDFPTFAEYEQNTTRTIPVVVLQLAG